MILQFFFFFCFFVLFWFFCLFVCLFFFFFFFYLFNFYCNAPDHFTFPSVILTTDFKDTIAPSRVCCCNKTFVVISFSACYRELNLKFLALTLFLMFYRSHYRPQCVDWFFSSQETRHCKIRAPTCTMYILEREFCTLYINILQLQNNFLLFAIPEKIFKYSGVKWYALFR